MKNTYPKDLCKLAIDNVETIEDSYKVIEIIENNIFTALRNYVIKFISSKKLKQNMDQNDWLDGHFWNNKWQENDNSKLAFFDFDHAKNGNSDWMISSLLGCRGAKIAIKFNIVFKKFGIKNQSSKLLYNFYKENEILQERGFYVNQEEKNSIDIDFTITKEEAFNCYFHNKHSFKELDNALNQIVYSLDLFDSFIKILKRN